MSNRLVMTRPLEVEVRLFKSDEHLALWLSPKKVDFLKTNIPGLKIIRVHNSSYGDIIVMPIVSDWDAADEKAKEEEANKK